MMVDKQGNDGKRVGKIFIVNKVMLNMYKDVR